MKHIFITGVLGLLIVIGVYVALHKNQTGPTACTTEAKICPDGSAVGRTGPNCAFAVCPTPTALTADTALAVGEERSVNALGIRLNSVTQDSRCPIDVQCIQAGSVTVSVTLSLPAKLKTVTMSLSSAGPAATFAGYRISITDVVPARQREKQIAPSDYRVTFHVTVDTKKAVTPIPI